MSTSTVPGSVFAIISQKTLSPRFSVTAKLLAVSGLVLFGGALLVTFRVMVLNAHHELQHPGIDFAICSMTATVGLGITRIYQGRVLRHRHGTRCFAGACKRNQKLEPPAFEYSSELLQSNRVHRPCPDLKWPCPRMISTV